MPLGTCWSRTTWEADGSDQKFSDFCKLVQDLGLPLNKNKVEPPSDRMTIMGINIDLVTKTLSIPSEKMKEIVGACHDAY